MVRRLRAHIKDTCNCGHTYNTNAIKNTYKRHAIGIGIAPKNKMQSESHLQDRSDRDCTCNKQFAHIKTNAISLYNISSLKMNYHWEFGIFQKQCIVIQRIGLSWGGGSCYMWYTHLEVLLLCSPPFLEKCPKDIMFSWGGTWKVLEKPLGCWFMIINWPSVYPPLYNLWSRNKIYHQEFW